MRISRPLIALSLVSVTWSTIHPITVPPDPTLKQLARVWVGHALDGWEFVRLELADSGKGILTIQTTADTPVAAYEVTKTVIQDDRITFSVRPMGAGSYPMFLHSEGALPWRLTLQMGGSTPPWKRKVMLYPLELFTQSIERLSKRADEVRGQHE